MQDKLFDIPVIVKENLPIQISKMYKTYGIDQNHICGDCKYFDRWNYHDKTYFKCEAYGISLSKATDWRKRWVACGKYKERA